MTYLMEWGPRFVTEEGWNLSKVACACVMDDLWFQKITITQIQYINVQQILVVTFEFTGAAYVLCGPQGQKGCWTALLYDIAVLDMASTHSITWEIQCTLNYNLLTRGINLVFIAAPRIRCANHSACKFCPMLASILPSTVHKIFIGTDRRRLWQPN